MKAQDAAWRVLASHWDGGLPVNPVRIARSLGVRVVEVDDPTVSGEYRNDGRTGPTISVNGRDSALRKRFTVAHELGHHALDHGPRFRDPATNYSLFNFDPKEAAANHFAAELLMPATLLRHWVIRKAVYDLKELADVFQVSQQAMRFRLKNMGLL